MSAALHFPGGIHVPVKRSAADLLASARGWAITAHERHVRGLALLEQGDLSGAQDMLEGSASADQRAADSIREARANG